MHGPINVKLLTLSREYGKESTSILMVIKATMVLRKLMISLATKVKMVTQVLIPSKRTSLTLVTMVILITIQSYV
jgi:hypothetical protein